MPAVAPHVAPEPDGKAAGTVTDFTICCPVAYVTRTVIPKAGVSGSERPDQLTAKVDASVGRDCEGQVTLHRT